MRHGTARKRGVLRWELVAAVALFLVGSASGASYEGYNLFSALNSTTAYLMDNDGNFVHSWSTDYTPGNAMYLLENGQLLHTGHVGTSPFDAGGAGGVVQLIEWDGTVSWSYEYSTTDHCQHHDAEMLPNGNVLMVAWQYKTQAEAIAAGRNPSQLSDGELWPDSVIEVHPTGPTTGDIVWEWHIWDHLVQDHDAAKANYGVVADHPERIDLNYGRGGADWTHVNSVDYDAQLDQILLSVHNFSEIWIIDHSTTTEEAAGHSGGDWGHGGDLLYRWGNPQAYGAGTASDQQLFVQHDAEWIAGGLSGAGDILIFNNGLNRPEGNYSSVVEIVPPLTNDGYSLSAGSTYGPTAPTWTYTASTPTDFYSQNISGAQRLPNGNTLICEGTKGRFFEVTSAGETVWDYSYTGQVFRVERYGRDYAGFDGTSLDDTVAGDLTYPIVDTNQGGCYNDTTEISAPSPGDAFYGQDAQFTRNLPSYTISQDNLTVTDNITGLVWTKSPDLDEDGDIDANDKLPQTEAEIYADALNSIGYGGRTDWRVPSIKELYSLIDYNGTDPMPTGSGTTGLTPFIDTDVFDFAYGDTASGERIIDAQYVSATNYVATVFNGMQATFGVNFADGRIKGYPSTKTFFVRFVAGNTSYGQNSFSDNGDSTVTDSATGLMWSQSDSGSTMMDWQTALAWVQARNAENYLGHSDWRLPSAKELQSILDYTRSPDTTDSAAIDPVFSATKITNVAGQADYPFFWTNTSFLRFDGSASAAVYVCFGRGLGSMDGTNVIDVHGAGCQRSDPKTGDPGDYPSWGNGPQGDVRRVFNCVRLVREAEGTVDPPQAAPAFTNTQTLAISATSHFYAGAFDFSAGQWACSLDAEAAGDLTYTFTKGAWVGLYLYDYEAQNWSDCGFIYRSE